MADKTITQLGAIDSLAVGDEFAVYDLSATTTKKASGTQVKAFATDVEINGLTGASPATGDSVVIYDVSATANRKATLSDVKSLMTDVDINGLTGASPATNDSVVIYDLSATANRKATISDILALGGGGSMDIVGLSTTTPATNDSIPVYDLSLTANRKVAVSDIVALSTLVEINGLTGASPATNDSVVIYDLSATANRKATISDILALASGGSGKLAQSLTPYAAAFPSSNFPQLNLSNGRPILGFDASTNESCTWTFYAPTGLAGALSAKVYWIAASATSGDVIWQVEIEAVSSGDSVDLDSTTSFDTANSGTTTVPGTAGYLAVTTITLTNADSIAASDYVRVRLTRNAASGSDTASGDANVLFVAVQES